MTAVSERPTGWKPIPLALKILSVFMALWAIGSVMNLPNLMANGLPFFGTFAFGAVALCVVLFFDFIGPAIFLFALWTRKHWGPKWATIYIGLFVLNGIVALVTVKAELGLAQILIPNVISLIFLSVIYWKLDYFKAVN
ncbi:hypothetical protein MWU61_13215 [Loktanella sp. F6476L]|uniref:hypothetical protein n=1 Tax=Loktanella sp. F6476L TaxID=2926405 RepID=UPI001FF65DB3|nr:hypothetical protein [Loktanella sp. F6476L]MCK0121506.1 hypothetical protein [Loktanella sp. F6476L]